jgi:hypothetical protein
MIAPTRPQITRQLSQQRRDRAAVGSSCGVVLIGETDVSPARPTRPRPDLPRDVTRSTRHYTSIGVLLPW